MITEMYRFSDDEIILKMKYTDLLDLGDEIYYLITKDEKNYPKCKEILEVIKDGKEKT